MSNVNVSNFTIANAQEQLAKAEKMIEIAKKTREDAIKAKTESETRLKLCEEELAQLGVTPENAKEELERLAAEIEKELQEIDDSIPVDMLRALKRI